MASPLSIVIASDALIRGLRPSKRVPRDSQFLIDCQGAVGRDGSLQGLDGLTRLATTAITDGWPYPQLFVCTNHIIICGATAIYEWVNSALVSKISGLTAGSPWTLVDFYDYLYLSNGTVAVVRRATDGVYATITTLPKAEALVNHGGQVLAGGITA